METSDDFMCRISIIVVAFLMNFWKLQIFLYIIFNFSIFASGFF